MKLVFLLIIFAVGACRAATPETSMPVEQRESAEITFPVQDRTVLEMDALLTGTLTQQGECLYVAEADSDRAILPIWPQGFSYEIVDGITAVLDEDEDRVAEVGSRFSISGGMLGKKGAVSRSTLEDRVGKCVGPYWLVGDIEPQ